MVQVGPKHSRANFQEAYSIDMYRSYRSVGGCGLDLFGPGFASRPQPPGCMWRCRWLGWTQTLVTTITGLRFTWLLPMVIWKPSRACWSSDIWMLGGKRRTNTQIQTQTYLLQPVYNIYKSLQIPQMFKIMHAHKHTEPGSTECWLFPTLHS